MSAIYSSGCCGYLLPVDLSEWNNFYFWLFEISSNLTSATSDRLLLLSQFWAKKINSNTEFHKTNKQLKMSQIYVL